MSLQVIENQEESCREILQNLRAKYPMRFARNAVFSVVGVWNESKQDYERCASLGIDGRWYAVELDILVNGKPLAIAWIED